MNLEKLRDKSGDAREILGLSESDAFVTSNGDWKVCGSSVNEIRFEGLTIDCPAAVPEFRDCSFRNCEFIGIKGKRCLLGNLNHWENCRFSNVSLDHPNCSYNRFLNCELVNSRFRQMVAMSCTFVDCQFDCFEFDALTVLANNRNSLVREDIAKKEWSYPELKCLDEERMSLYFKACVFSDVSISRSQLRTTKFSECLYSASSIESSDLSNVCTDVEWWKDSTASGGDLEDAYLSFCLKSVVTELGPEHPVSVVLTDFVAQGSRDSWFDHVLDRLPGVADEEYAKLVRIQDAALRIFPGR